MRCPSCAEEIQDEAKKCRFCGEILTKAVKLGYPAFYENVASWGGLSFDALLMDYGDFLYPGDGFGDCCLSAQNPLANIDNLGDEDKPYNREKVQRLTSAMINRLQEIVENTQEALVLRVMVMYLRPIDDLLKIRESGADGSYNNSENLAAYVKNFEELKKPLSQIQPQGREELEKRIDIATEWSQDRLRAIIANQPKLTPSLPVSSSGTKRGGWGCVSLLLVATGAAAAFAAIFAF